MTKQKSHDDVFAPFDPTSPREVPVDRRIDFVILFDVNEGNPNGDPARNNTPRTDPYDGRGLVTDVAIKRRVRDYLTDQCGHEMFITRKAISLNTLLKEVSDTIDPAKKTGKKGKAATEERAARAEALCRRFIDVRLFGAMAETGDTPAGRVRGPVQLTMARSLHPINISKHQITRIALTKDGDMEKGSTMSDENGRQIIKYACYRMIGTFTPSQAQKTGLSPKDLGQFFDALVRFWAHDRASARGVMGCRGIFLAIHDTQDGRCHAQDLVNAVQVEGGQDAWGTATVTKGQPGVSWWSYGFDGLQAL